MEELYKIIWQNKGKKWHIIVDGYGIGISDDWVVDRPTVYDTSYCKNFVAYDFPERLPQYIKTAMKRIANKYGAAALSRINGQIYKTFGLEV